jgi:hypothetical protein
VNEADLRALLDDAHTYIVNRVENWAYINDETESLLRRIEDALKTPAAVRVTSPQNPKP